MRGHAYRQRIALLTLALFLIGYSASIPPVRSFSNQDEEIVLTEGTPINVVTTQEITSKTASPNDPVNFKVDEDLAINGHVIVSKGTPARGSVINAKRAVTWASQASSGFRSNQRKPSTVSR